MRAVVRSFYVPRTPVAIADCADPPEARAIRTLLGKLGAVVAMHTSRLQYGGTFVDRGYTADIPPLPYSWHPRRQAPGLMPTTRLKTRVRWL